MVRRVFGASIGTLDDRIQDPNYGDAALVKDFFRPVWPKYTAPFKKTKLSILKSFSKYNYYHQEANRLRIKDELVRRINNGTADMNLFLYLEEKAREEYMEKLPFKLERERTRSRMDFTLDWVYKHSVNPEVFGLYKELIDKAETKESIPYFLQAIESRLVVREDEAFKTNPEIFLEQERRSESEEHFGPSYGMYERRCFTVLYDVFVQVSFHKAYMPFAQAAKEKLSAMLDLVNDDITKKINAAIARLDEELEIPIAYHNKIYKIVSRA